MKVDVLLGLQWGDEGKGKIVDVLTPDYEVIARFQGGPNAGHTLKFNGITHVLHTIPSGIFHSDTMNLVGNGVVIDPVIFKKEVDALKALGVDMEESLSLSRKAHLILPTHGLLDAASEAAKEASTSEQKIGSTLKGIGPTYMDKTGRNGLRIGDIEDDNFREKYERLKAKHLKMLDQHSFDHGRNLDAMEAAFFEGIELLRALPIVDSEHYVNNALANNQSVLAEGAQGTLLDIDFGSYPFVTSSNTICAGACTGLGIAPNRIGEVIGIFKAYCTRVGSGPFPTELEDADGEQLRKIGQEFGATTGRPRRCGWLDLPALKYAIMINGATKLTMTKADVLSGFEIIKVCTHYEMPDGKVVDFFPYEVEGVTPVYKEMRGWKKDLTGLDSIDALPEELVDYIDYLEAELHVPITIVSVGPDRTQTLHRSHVPA
jgi:adenylosuccinate synthase